LSIKSKIAESMFQDLSRVLARNAMVTQASIQSLIDSARESAKTYIGWG
jgi:hypothetical protein